MSVNLAIIVGNVGKDPDVKVFDGGTKKATFTVATSKKFKDKSGNMQEKTEWHNMVCWRNTADVVERYVRKGTQVYIQGEITTRSYDDQNGQKRYVTEIAVANLQLLGRKDDSQQGQQGQPAYQAPMQQQTYQAPPAQPQAPVPASESLEPQPDDLPF